MKTAILLLGMIAAVTLTAQSIAPAASDHEQWAAACLREMQSVKVGMKRADLEKVFETAGGLAERLHRTYAYKHCPYFKVDVDFSAADPQGGDENDRIERISKPYLEWPAGD